MAFHPIDRDTWDRAERFEHYFSQVPCFYSMTVVLSRFYRKIFPFPTKSSQPGSDCQPAPGIPHGVQ